MTDPIADFLTRVRNALSSEHGHYVDVPFSRMTAGIADILQDEGYIKGCKTMEANGRYILRILMKYDASGKNVIANLLRVSTPGRRDYVGKEKIPRVRNGLGVAILSTSKGLLTDRKARELGVGGEVMCYIW